MTRRIGIFARKSQVEKSRERWSIKPRDDKLKKLGANTKATNKLNDNMRSFQNEKLALARQSTMKMKLLSIDFANNVPCAKTMLETELQRAMMDETELAVSVCAAGDKCFYVNLMNRIQRVLTR
jgi:hypothetical protein